ncbi:hypothetical protein HDU93_007220 [Gonapodya sp. JEL0774]|nr:hypothetical protein HDU93_007220 [Gonapodya sp. JEL0774]
MIPPQTQTLGGQQSEVEAEISMLPTSDTPGPDPAPVPSTSLDEVIPPDETAMEEPSADSFIVDGTFSRWTVSSKVLGAGAFAEVREAVSEKGMKAVVKICDVSPSTERRSLYAFRELACLAYLSMGRRGGHPNIVRLYDTARVNDLVLIFMEKVEGVELFDFMKSFSDGLPAAHVRHITAQLLSALRYVHHHSVLHRDIKLDNVLVNPQTLHITLIDFNLAGFYEEQTQLIEPVGCINYSSLQILEAARGKPYLPTKGWSDLWALGVSIYGMLCGYFPFRSEKPNRLAKEHLALLKTPLSWSNSAVDPEARSFVECILTPTSLGRISAESLMEHPFVAGHDAFRIDPDVSGLQHQFESLVRGNQSLISSDFDLQEEAVLQLVQEILGPMRAALEEQLSRDWDDEVESELMQIERSKSDSTVGSETIAMRSNSDMVLEKAVDYEEIRPDEVLAASE